MTKLFKSAAGIAIAALSLSASPSFAQSMSLEVDQSRPLQFTRPVTGVVVGNAGVADVIVHDTKTLLVVGKSVGSTHVLAVDQRGRTVYSGTIQVTTPVDTGIVTIQRGKNAYVNNCRGRCVLIPTSESTGEGLTVAIQAATSRTGFASGGGTTTTTLSSPVAAASAAPPR